MDFGELKMIKSVCKTFHQILKENERFWKLYSERILHQTELPKHYTNWKQFFKHNFILFWDESNKGPHFKIDPFHKRLISYSNSVSWECAVSKSILLENFLYKFKFVSSW